MAPGQAGSAGAPGRAGDDAALLEGLDPLLLVSRVASWLRVSGSGGQYYPSQFAAIGALAGYSTVAADAVASSGCVVDLVRGVDWAAHGRSVTLAALSALGAVASSAHGARVVDVLYHVGAGPALVTAVASAPDDVAGVAVRDALVSVVKGAFVRPWLSC